MKTIDSPAQHRRTFARRFPPTLHPSADRCGFTLLELITAMLASTALVATLAATVVISTQMLESAPSDQDQWHDRFIADRIANDLRYATTVDDTPANGFALTKVDPVSGAEQSINYNSNQSGFTRRIDTGPRIQLDPSAGTDNHYVDRYQAGDATGVTVGLRATSSAATTGTASSLDVPVPPGCVTGDRIVFAMSAKTPTSVSIDSPGFQIVHSIGINDLRLIVMHQPYTATLGDTVSVSVSPDSAIAAVMLAIENSHTSDPIAWSAAAGGFAWSFFPTTHPRPLESADMTDTQMNLQIYAGDRQPWKTGAMGMAGFAEAIQATAAAGNISVGNTIGVVLRHGNSPSLNTSQRLWHQDSGFWLQSAISVEANP